MNRVWTKVTLFSLLGMAIVFPPLASTKLIEEKFDRLTLVPRFNHIHQGTPFIQIDFTPNLIVHPEYQFSLSQHSSADFITVAIVNEVLWNLVKVDQVDRHWLTPLLKENKQLTTTGIATSSEGYTKKADSLKGITLVKQLSSKVPIQS